MARSKFSKMLEKINNNEEVINAKEVEYINENINEVEENNTTISLNSDVEDGIENNIEDGVDTDVKNNLENYIDAENDIDAEDNNIVDYINEDDSLTLNNDELEDELEDDEVEEDKSNDELEDESDNKSDDESENNLKDKSKNKSNGKKDGKIKKNSILYDMLSRPEGATLDELEIELGWKRPSIRGVMSNMQKELEFCLLTIDVSKPTFNKDNGSKAFKKETRYFIRDCEFDLNDTLITLFKIDDTFGKKNNNSL